MKIVELIFYCITILYCINVLYVIRGWLRCNYFHPNENYRPTTTITVVIPVRNEEKHIAKLLEDLEKQNYPKTLFEICIVDDNSTDGTSEILKKSKLDNLKVIHLNLESEINSYKKKAIEEAIVNSSADLIVNTDGDCRIHENWLKSIAEFYERNTYKLISAPVTFHEDQHWYEKLQTIEFQYLIGLGAATITNKIPTTCNGANLIYERKVFNEVKGFENIDEVASGDDELLMHRINKYYPNSIGFLKSRDAIVKTYAKSSLSEFIEQRIRWASISVIHTSFVTTYFLGMAFLLNLSYVISLITLLFSNALQEYLLISFLIKLVIDGSFIYLTLNFFQNRKHIAYLLLVNLFYIIYVVLIGIIINFQKKYTWKGRSVK